jgi:hypothetical protein
MMSRNILDDRRLGNVGAEFQQFAVNARGAPRRFSQLICRTSWRMSAGSCAGIALASWLYKTVP